MAKAGFSPSTAAFAVATFCRSNSLRCDFTDMPQGVEAYTDNPHPLRFTIPLPPSTGDITYTRDGLAVTAVCVPADDPSEVLEGASSEDRHYTHQRRPDRPFVEVEVVAVFDSVVIVQARFFAGSIVHPLHGSKTPAPPLRLRFHVTTSGSDAGVVATSDVVICALRAKSPAERISGSAAGGRGRPRRGGRAASGVGGRSGGAATERCVGGKSRRSPSAEPCGDDRVVRARVIGAIDVTSPPAATPPPPTVDGGMATVGVVPAVILSLLTDVDDDAASLGYDCTEAVGGSLVETSFAFPDEFDLQPSSPDNDL